MLKPRSLLAHGAKSALLFGMVMGANAANTYPDLQSRSSLIPFSFTPAIRVDRAPEQQISAPDEGQPNLSYGILAGLMVMAAIAVRRKT